MNGWNSKQLGELCDVLDHRRKPITKRDRTAGEYPYYGATGILDYVAGYLFDEPLVLVGEDGAKWASGESTAFSVEGKVWVNNHAHVLRPFRRQLLDSWLIYYLNYSDLTEFVSGLTVPKLNQGSLREIPIPLPPISEQRRIAGILDEAFVGIAVAKANTEKNLQNARAVFESYLTEALISEDKNWPSRRLDTLLMTARKISYGIVKPGKHDPDGVRLIKSQQVRDNSMYLEEDFRITRELDEEYARTRLRGGEILLNLVGASIGRSAIAPAELQGANVSRAIAVIPVRHEVARWVQYNLRCSVGQTAIQAKTGGSAQPVLNLSEVKSMAIPSPPLSEQRATVKKLDELTSETQDLESIYRRKLAALDSLKGSLLHQAFTGRL